ncbi:DUF4136 domain-containing protein [Noviherbaspirillum sp. Root189]|uniref:DUF4136 domain-containing protein n=1 Tax=Noviherbaspirillum sp. Root189 TaxID=1736487 RepID=UPI00070E18E5|nr:DUF4136 domain-containing protein [Noviherbaspirillum sp. Root189]KRB93827.1 hypothetical protein ASE07_12245 [Noviherbaspirillum sp. Root189]
MKRWLVAGMMAITTLLLGGCATSTIRSDVTAFHEWPDTLPDKSYVFERTKDQNDSLEYRSYEDLVRAELNRLGFTEAPASTTPALKAALSYSITGRDVREVYPVVVNPYWYGPAWRGYYGPFYDPFYDPFWYGPPVVEQRVSQYQLFTRQLKIILARMADGKKLYETTVVSEGTNRSLAAIMPYMVRSAFVDFPGKSGVPRRIELEVAKQQK